MIECSCGWAGIEDELVSWYGGNDPEGPERCPLCFKKLEKGGVWKKLKN